MQYLLKDADLRAMLDSYSEGRFSGDLAKAVEKYYENGDPVRVPGSGLIHVRTELLFTEDEIKCVDKYEPGRWNEWPDVEPPEGVPMAIEFQHEPDSEVKRACWTYRDGSWWDGTFRISLVRVHVVRFRPWIYELNDLVGPNALVTTLPGLEWHDETESPEGEVPENQIFLLAFLLPNGKRVIETGLWRKYHFMRRQLPAGSRLVGWAAVRTASAPELCETETIVPF